MRVHVSSFKPWSKVLSRGSYGVLWDLERRSTVRVCTRSFDHSLCEPDLLLWLSELTCVCEGQDMSVHI